MGLAAASEVPGLLQMLQHTWTYRPLVHDVLGMALNRIALEAEPSSAPTPLAAAKPAGKRSVEVGEGDFFWEANARSTFPKVAADVDVQLTKYKQVGCAPRPDVVWR